MKKHPLWAVPVGWEKDYIADVSPGIDPELYPWHTNKSSDGRSKYATTGSATRLYTRLHMGVFNAVKAYIAALGFKGDKTKVAVGQAGDLYLAELELPDGSRQIAAYNSKTQNIEAATVTLSGRYLDYSLTDKSQECGMILFLALLPLLLQDEEAAEAFRTFSKLYAKDEFTDETGNAISKLSDNIYRRITLGLFEVKIPPGGNVRFMSQTKIKTGAYAPDAIIGGEFAVFLEKSVSTITTSISIEEARALYKEFNEGRQWTEEEQMLYAASVARIEDNAPVSKEALRMAKYITASSCHKNPIRNFFWRGETGFGKSYGCEELAAILGMPLLRITCTPEMETSDFLCRYVPDSTSSPKLQAYEHMQQPSLEEIFYDPVTAYKKITGKYWEEVTPEICFNALIEAELARKLQEHSSVNTPRFKLVLAEYIKALIKGYIIEVQEVSIISKSGVLAGLNEYNRPGSVITLLDGTQVTRHPNAIVIFTDNVSYEGCRPIHQSVIARNFAAFDSYDMEKPDVIKRIKAMTDVDDDVLLEDMYDIWFTIRQYCKDNQILDGAVSIRELANWVEAVNIMGLAGNELRETCIETVVAKATAIEEEKEQIIAACLDTKLPA